MQSGENYQGKLWLLNWDYHFCVEKKILKVAVVVLFVTTRTEKYLSLHTKPGHSEIFEKYLKNFRRLSK
jgi:hypothetical protein